MVVNSSKINRSLAKSIVIMTNTPNPALYCPPTTQDYVPAVVNRLLNRIISIQPEKAVLYGFSKNMRWLLRLMREMGCDPALADWRTKFIGYDCGGKKVRSITDFRSEKNCLLIMALEDIGSIKEGMKYLFFNELNDLPVIYDRTEYYSHFHQEDPYRLISERARNRAISMISDAQLFDLIQYVSLTKNVPGDVVEFGSLYGGSGAIIAEALNHYGKRPLWLFDTFKGIPQSRYGLDYCWNNSFTDNSFSEVRDAFKDLDNVKVIAGNILETFNLVTNPISFGYLASDTLESGEALLNFMWPKLSPGGIIAVCDYGSFPNCIPLTMYCDHFFSDKQDAFIFYPANLGIFVMKKSD
jgi:O-methyltransferase